MTIIETWEETKKLGSFLDHYGVSLEETKELVSAMFNLLSITNNSKILMKAIKRETALVNYQNKRKKYPFLYKRSSYKSKANIAIENIRHHATACEKNGSYFMAIDVRIFNLYTPNFSATTIWRIKKELENLGITILES